jgi:quinol monooxygenase YgiN
MPVVVAIQTPKPGRLQDVLSAFSVITPLVHEERGCELYAVHTDGAAVYVIERWTTMDDLDAHAAGLPLVQLDELRGDALAEPVVVHVMENVPIGLAAVGTIQ